jgi:hypothetical protein
MDLMVAKAIWVDRVVEGLTPEVAAGALVRAGGWLFNRCRPATPEELETAASWGSTGTDAILGSAVSIGPDGSTCLMVTLEKNPLPQLPDVFVVYAPYARLDAVRVAIEKSTEPPATEPVPVEEVDALLAQARVFKVSEEYYAARDEAEALEAWYAQTGDPRSEDLEAEPVDMEAPQEWQGEAFTWRELAREALERDGRLPCWIGSTYD